MTIASREPCVPDCTNRHQLRHPSFERVSWDNAAVVVLEVLLLSLLVPGAKTRRRSGLICIEMGKILIKDVYCLGKGPSLTMLRDNLPEPVFSVRKKIYPSCFIVVWASLNLFSLRGRDLGSTGAAGDPSRTAHIIRWDGCKLHARRRGARPGLWVWVAHLRSSKTGSPCTTGQQHHSP